MMDESGNAGRVTRSAARRMSTDFVDTPSKTISSRGRKSVTNASSDDGSATASALSARELADGIESSPSVRMTRNRRNSLLTEENVALHSPSRRSVRAQSIVSDDMPASQASTSKSRSVRRTPSKKEPTTPKHEYADLKPRPFKIVLSRTMPSPVPAAIPEEEPTENAGEETASADPELEVNEGNVTASGVNAEGSEEMPAQTNEPEQTEFVTLSNQSVQIDSEIVDVNIWAPKEDPERTFSGMEAMDVDRTVVTISDDEDEDDDVSVLAPVQEELTDSNNETASLREQVTSIYERLLTPDAKKLEGGQAKTPKGSAKKTPSPRPQVSDSSPHVRSDNVLTPETTGSKKQNTPIIETDPIGFELTGFNRQSLSTRTPLKAQPNIILPKDIETDSMPQLVAGTPTKTVSTDQKEDPQLNTSSTKLDDNVEIQTVSLPQIIIDKNVALAQEEDLNSTPEIDFDMKQVRFRLRAKSENTAITPNTARKSLKLNELLAVDENGTPNVPKSKITEQWTNGSEQTAIKANTSAVQPSPKATSLQPQIEQIFALPTVGSVTPRKHRNLSLNSEQRVQETVVSPKFRKDPTIVEEDIFATTPPPSKEPSKPEEAITKTPNKSKNTTPKLVPSDTGSLNVSDSNAKKTPQKAVEPAIPSMAVEKEAVNVPSPVKLPTTEKVTPAKAHAISESPIRNTPVLVTGITPMALTKANPVKQMVTAETKIQTPPLPARLARKSANFDKGATPKPNPNSEGEKHADTPFPHNKSSSASNVSRNASLKDADVSTISQKSLNFANLWEPAVKGKADVKIDTMGVQSPGTDDIPFIRVSKNRSTMIFESADEAEEEEASRNSFLDDEAEEVDDEEESMDEEERQYLKDNEIPERGEDIGSEDTADDVTEEESDEHDSFIVSDGNISEADYESDELPEKKKKRYSRILPESGSSDDEEIKPIETVDKDDTEMGMPILARLKKMEHRKSLVTDNVATEPIKRSRKSLSAVDKATLPVLPFPNFILPTDQKESSEEETSPDEIPMYEKVARNSSRKSMPILEKSMNFSPALNKSLSAADKTARKSISNFATPQYADKDDSEDEEMPIADKIKKIKSRKSIETAIQSNAGAHISEEDSPIAERLKKLQKLSITGSFHEEPLSLADTKTPLKPLAISTEKTTSNKKSARKSLQNKTSGFVEESVNGDVATENIGDQITGEVKRSRKSTEWAESENASGSTKKQRKLSLNKSLNISKTFEETNKDELVALNNTLAESETEVSVDKSAKKRRSINKSNESFVENAHEQNSSINSDPKAKTIESSNRAILRPTKSDKRKTEPIGAHILSEQNNNFKKSTTADVNIGKVDLTAILERCQSELATTGENRKRQREEAQNEIDEEKALKRKLKKEKKKAEREAEKRKQEEREEMAKKVNKQKKLIAQTATNANEIAIDGLVPKQAIQKSKARRAEVEDDSTTDTENVRPAFQDPQIPTNFNFQPKGRKRLQILRDKKAASTWAVSDRTPSPPPRIQNGFLETPQTPVTHNWNVKNLKPVLFNAGKKRKVREIVEPINVLPKPKWSNENGLASSSKRFRPSNGLVNQSDSSEFRVQSLPNHNKKKKARDLLPQELLNFRQQNMYGANTPRVDSTTLNRQKQAKLALSKTR